MKRIFAILIHSLWLGAIASAHALGATPQAAGTLIEQQRAAFRHAWPLAERGEASAVKQNEQLLASYPLYPDLIGIVLRARLGAVDDREVGDFIERLDGHPAAQRLRKAWLHSLAKRAKWQEYAVRYGLDPGDNDDATLACHALTAQLALGQTADLRTRALALWMNGHSQPDACDPAFAYLARTGALTTQRLLARIGLAIDAREFGLARYLARDAGPDAQHRVAAWQRMHSDPADQLRAAQPDSDNEETRARLLYGLKRLARRDPLEAASVWASIGSDFAFEPRQRSDFLRACALSAARDRIPQALAMLTALPDAAVDKDVAHWRVRSALYRQDWVAAQGALAGLEEDEAKREVWRYWRARAFEENGAGEEAERVYADLARERSYHGFLAADRRSLPYAFAHRAAIADEAQITALEMRADIIRARELFFTGLSTLARSEWNRAVAGLAREAKAQAAILADRWGWHSRAIELAPASGLLDDLDLRYPLPWAESFVRHSRSQGLSTAWSLGIARSESLFIPDIRSSAGALGLMQLMPATGRETARSAGLKYRGSGSLLEPEVNIALGTLHLGKVQKQFDGHRVLSTAAYNAGARRVRGWLPQAGQVPADVWIETIPFNETRAYVQRVLAADAVFFWRMEGREQRLATFMSPVAPPSRQ